jgi:hypothetical protein
MIVWGGYSGGDVTATGGRYDMAKNRWTATWSAGLPAAREEHTAVWDGGGMIIWGGYDSMTSGSRYDPAIDGWIATTLTGAPTGRHNHSAVWTGSEMIVWGGSGGGTYLNSGGRYRP